MTPSDDNERTVIAAARAPALEEQTDALPAATRLHEVELLSEFKIVGC